MTDEILEHYGVARRSGRYEYGSGKDPQRSKDFLSKVDEYRSKGMSDKEIATELGLNTTQFRNQIAWANQDRKQVLLDGIISRSERGLNNVQIANDLNISEASVRNYLANKDSAKFNKLDNIVDSLKESIENVEYLDIGIGTELQMGISRNKLQNAVAKLKEEGYVEHEIYIKRLTDPSKYTTVTVLTKEKDLDVVKRNSEKIRPPQVWTEDGGETMIKVKNPKSIDWDRISIEYAEAGGTDKDGLIEMRRGAKDLDLGNSKYAQVRIAVGGTHYLKGMAMYADDLPDGVDIRFNTNKSKTTAKADVLKEMKLGKDNVFGATISRQKGALNIVNEEGDWDTWSSGLSSQMLSKQPISLVKDRLDVTYKKALDDYKEIMSLNNPLVRKHLLESYDNEVNSKAKHLKVLGLPRTKGHVILPYPELSPNEVYAPNYKNGEKLVLVRYPHGGTFELPELTVNNKNKKAKGTIGNALDAIGIHPSVATKLSGADFDGDTVYAIPNNNRKIKTSRALKELKNFDPSMYKVGPDSHAIIRKLNPKTGEMESTGLTITSDYKQKQMGLVSNLITDMTIKGASQSEIARAVKHSMVVIDSEKHKLNWKKSAEDNAIGALQKKYQTYVSNVDGKKHQAASTLISRSKHTFDVEEVNPKTGKTKMVKKSIIDMVPDATYLSSGTAVENLYAGYINNLKVVSSNVKKDLAKTPSIKKDPAMAKKYSAEVASLDSKLKAALLNAPRERQAQILGTSMYYKNLDYEMSKKEKKRLRAQSIVTARDKVGAERKEVVITDREWEAIQKGAISNEKFDKILRNADMDKVKKLATPKPSNAMSSSKISKVKTLLDNGYTYAEVAAAVGVSTTTIRDVVIEERK